MFFGGTWIDRSYSGSCCWDGWNYPSSLNNREASARGVCNHFKGK